MKGRVRFFCACGQELWQGLGDDQKKTLTIKGAEETAICSDCLELQSKDYETINGKWWEFNRGVPVRPLTDGEAATVIWDSTDQKGQPPCPTDST